MSRLDSVVTMFESDPIMQRVLCDVRLPTEELHKAKRKICVNRFCAKHCILYADKPQIVLLTKEY